MNAVDLWAQFCVGSNVDKMPPPLIALCRFAFAAGLLNGVQATVHAVDDCATADDVNPALLALLDDVRALRESTPPIQFGGVRVRVGATPDNADADAGPDGKGH